MDSKPSGATTCRGRGSHASAPSWGRWICFIPVLAIFLLLMPGAEACINTGGTTLEGKETSPVGLYMVLPLQAAYLETPAGHLAKIIQRRGDLSDDQKEGIVAVYEGQYDKAVAVFSAIEAKRPGEYQTAANLGTAYELQGNLEEALKWIEEGIRRNPDSHHGTEWLHVAILKTRMLLNENPAWLGENHVITLPDDLGQGSVVDSGGTKLRPGEVLSALIYQLKERMVFVKAPDPVVADLLYLLAVVVGKTEAVEPALQLVDMARQYGFGDAGLLDSMTASYQKALIMRRIREGLMWGGGVLLGLVFLVFAWRRKWFFLSGAAYRKHLAEKAG